MCPSTRKERKWVEWATLEGPGIRTQLIIEGEKESEIKTVVLRSLLPLHLLLGPRNLIQRETREALAALPTGHLQGLGKRGDWGYDIWRSHRIHEKCAANSSSNLHTVKPSLVNIFCICTWMCIWMKVRMKCTKILSTTVSGWWDFGDSYLWREQKNEERKINAGYSSNQQGKVLNFRWKLCSIT